MLLATHGGLSLELCAVLYPISPMALYRLVCALGQQSLVAVLTRCGLPLPTYILADEKHSRCLTEKVYLPTIVSGRVLGHLGYTTEASTATFIQSYQVFQRAAVAQEPTYRVRSILTDGFDSTTKSMRTLFPGARLGCGRRTRTDTRLVPQYPNPHLRRVLLRVTPLTTKSGGVCQTVLQSYSRKSLVKLVSDQLQPFLEKIDPDTPSETTARLLVDTAEQSNRLDQLADTLAVIRDAAEPPLPSPGRTSRSRIGGRYGCEMKPRSKIPCSGRPLRLTPLVSSRIRGITILG
jgi:hypothetical protein